MGAGRQCPLERGVVMQKMRMLTWASVMFLCSFAQAYANSRPAIYVIDGKAFAFQDVLEEGKDGRPDKLGPVTALDVVEAYENDNPNVVADCSKYSRIHKGAVWCFQNEANLKLFVESIGKDGDSKYEPAFGGYCALGLSRMNQNVPGGDPRTAVVMATVSRPSGFSLVLNGGFGARARFLADTNGRALLAETGYLSQLRAKVLVPNDKLNVGKKAN